MFSLSDLPD